MTKVEICDKEARKFAISISLDFALSYEVSICLDSIALKREIEARSCDKKGQMSNSVIFLIWGLTNGIALTANACNLGLRESSVEVD